MSVTWTAAERRLTAGDPAPDFTLSTQDGGQARLSDLRGRPVVLFFYPKDHSLVCTMEACHFRDAYADFEGLEAAVIGISEDDAESHQRFAEGHRLPYRLATDADGEVQRRYGLKKVLGISERATFVIDREGIIRSVITSPLNIRAHVTTALETLRTQRLPSGAS